MYKVITILQVLQGIYLFLAFFFIINSKQLFFSTFPANCYFKDPILAISLLSGL